jgi:GNAT superfamily N-acetyltransferase
MNLAIRPLTRARWPDLEALFASKGCSIPRGCWCMYFRESGKPALAPGVKLQDQRKQALHALAGRRPAVGLLGYRDGTPVGWVTMGPREDFARLRRSPVMKPADEQPVWSVPCFVVPPEHRHQGVASALLHGAVDYARRQGATLLEAYPVDKAQRGADDWMWHGAKSMYDKLGFEEVARRRPQRPVVRLRLAEGS